MQTPAFLRELSARLSYSHCSRWLVSSLYFEWFDRPSSRLGSWPLCYETDYAPTSRRRRHASRLLDGCGTRSADQIAARKVEHSAAPLAAGVRAPEPWMGTALCHRRVYDCHARRLELPLKPPVYHIGDGKPRAFAIAVTDRSVRHCLWGHPSKEGGISLRSRQDRLRSLEPAARESD